MKFKTVYIILTLILLGLIVGGCNSFFAHSTPVLPPTEPAWLVTPTQVASVPTATLPASVPGLPTLPPQPQPTSSVKRISFAPGATSATVQNSLGVNGIDYYALRVSAGQKMRVNLTSPQANMIFSVSGLDGQVLKSSGAGRGPWEGVVPTTQDYMLIISTENGMAANYTLQVTIPPLAPVVESTPVPKRISFAPGAIAASIQGSTATPGQDRFVIRALAGQTMTVNAVSAQNNVIVIIYGADGNVLISDHAGATTWTGVLPTTQDYFIDTRSVGSNVVPFTLQVTIPPK